MTTTDAASYLSQLGLSLPEPILAALVARVDALNPCLSQYSDAEAALIRYYLIGLLAISSGGRRVKSQSAPSGASQSYSYGTLSEQMRQLKSALALLDTAGCTADLIPSEPDPQAAMFVVTGRRCGPVAAHRRVPRPSPGPDNPGPDNPGMAMLVDPNDGTALIAPTGEAWAQWITEMNND